MAKGIPRRIRLPYSIIWRVPRKSERDAPGGAPLFLFFRPAPQRRRPLLLFGNVVQHAHRRHRKNERRVPRTDERKRQPRRRDGTAHDERVDDDLYRIDERDARGEQKTEQIVLPKRSKGRIL